MEEMGNNAVLLNKSKDSAIRIAQGKPWSFCFCFCFLFALSFCVCVFSCFQCSQDPPLQGGFILQENFSGIFFGGNPPIFFGRLGWKKSVGFFSWGKMLGISEKINREPCLGSHGLIIEEAAIANISLPL